MRTRALIACCLLPAIFCHAQDPGKQKNNSLFVEFGKTGLIYNLGYDHLFRNVNIGVRAVAGTNGAKYLSASVVGAGGYYLIGKKSSFLELGLDVQYLSVNETSDDQRGFTFIYPDYTIKTYYISMNAGYRYYGRALFRIGFSPGFIKNDFIPGGYISLGFTF